MLKTHARLSASSAERFINCAGSVSLAELLPPQDESEYAAEGTAAHKLGEACLREQKDAFAYLGRKFYGHVVDTEMAEAVQIYVDYVREMSEGDCEVKLEHSFTNSVLGPDFGGTTDAVITRIIDGQGFIHVVDYKHGAGLAVDIEDNRQLMYYAFGALNELEIPNDSTASVELTIVQPRAFHEDGEIREQWKFVREIYDWANGELIPAMKRVDAPDADFNLGEWCRFCSAKLICSEMLEAFEMATTTDPEEIPGFTDDDLAAAFSKIQAARFYIKAVEAECQKRAMAGQAVAGTKLVYGKSSRVWKDAMNGIPLEDALEAEFGDAAYSDPAMLSPAQIEKLPGGKKFAGQWAYKNRGRPRLAAAHERGEPYDPEAEGESFVGIDTKSAS